MDQFLKKYRYYLVRSKMSTHGPQYGISYLFKFKIKRKQWLMNGSANILKQAKYLTYIYLSILWK